MRREFSTSCARCASRVLRCAGAALALAFLFSISSRRVFFCVAFSHAAPCCRVSSLRLVVRVAVSEAEQIGLFRLKLRMCCAVFDFDEPDVDQRYRDKKLGKTGTLKELIAHVEDVDGLGAFQHEDYRLLFEMVRLTLCSARLQCRAVVFRLRCAVRAPARLAVLTRTRTACCRSNAIF